VQGFVAGVNAALKIKGEEPMILDRSQAYIGTLIDDLVTKGTNEPYRMMTSRSEYRLLHRQDNADIRLCAIGYRIGLVSDERWQRVQDKYAAVEKEAERIEHTHIATTPELRELLESKNSSVPPSGACIADLIRRPELGYEELAPFDKNRPELPKVIREQVEITVKYAGYIKRQIKQAEEFKRLENKRIPDDIDFMSIHGVRTEARQKLTKVRPANFGQASRISGVSPADIAALMVYLEKGERHE